MPSLFLTGGVNWSRESNSLPFSGWRTAHYSDVIMSPMASQITSLTVVYSTVYSGTDQRKHQTPRYWPFVREFTGNRWIPLTKGQLRGKCFHLMTSSWNVLLCHTYQPRTLHYSNVRQHYCHSTRHRQLSGPRCSPKTFSSYYNNGLLTEISCCLMELRPAMIASSQIDQ